MEKTISANQLKKNLSAVLREVNRSGEAMVVDSPTDEATAIVSLDDYRRFLELEKYQRRRDAFAELERIRLDIDNRLQDLPNEDRARLAEEISKDTMDRILAKGQFRFVEP